LLNARYINYIAVNNSQFLKANSGAILIPCGFGGALEQE